MHFPLGIACIMVGVVIAVLTLVVSAVQALPMVRRLAAGEQIEQQDVHATWPFWTAFAAAGVLILFGSFQILG